MSSERLLRIYKKFYFDEVKSHTLLYGVLSGSCSACKEIDIKLDALECSSCHTPFKYIAFMNPREHMPKIQRIMHERPNIVLVDYDDFKKVEGELKARDILG
jgi:thiol-disulfide isomerase/thioredoxin